MALLSLIWQNIKVFPHFIFLFFSDLIHWLKRRGWSIFEGWGLHIYLGAFGQGKTSSMVRDAYNICRRYPSVTLLTNVDVLNFPKHTKIQKLRCARDILNAPDNTLVLIDEIGTIFNSRDWASSKGSMPKPLFQHICQCRHRHLAVLATTQDWGFLDKQLRQIATDVTVCSASFAHPFSRKITNKRYNAREYDNFQSNPLLPLTCLSVDVYLQTDFIRSLYDTREMVQTIMQMDFIPDADILANQGDTSPAVIIDNKPKTKKLLRKV